MFSNYMSVSLDLEPPKTTTTTMHPPTTTPPQLQPLSCPHSSPFQAGIESSMSVIEHYGVA